jgi:hypothetical protein
MARDVEIVAVSSVLGTVPTNNAVLGTTADTGLLRFMGS